MKLAHRLGYYGFGLVLGIIILIFFLSGKRASCDYSPTARVLKNIRIKERNFSEESLAFFANHSIDTAVVSKILQKGDVDFSESKTDLEPCNIYVLIGKTESGELKLHIENCEEVATVLSVEKTE
ncbi:hypothetical protein RM549_12060 [Salegentibacter sp. F188]|uniref:DUF4258 domain-containing protein n=1 Tax=Autumnicola patrickiae TaxID=3075591 RepID=A0ABU3E4D6_9FLAO|nr:hypothetical protein [Salegentibacter sp. F188]MDT0690524.1 hypothetical protein [Salegentibacter sp. F188]